MAVDQRGEQVEDHEGDAVGEARANDPQEVAARGDVPAPRGDAPARGADPAARRDELAAKGQVGESAAVAPGEEEGAGERDAVVKEWSRWKKCRLSKCPEGETRVLRETRARAMGPVFPVVPTTAAWTPCARRHSRIHLPTRVWIRAILRKKHPRNGDGRVMFSRLGKTP